MPRDRIIGFNTAEGQIFSACIEGLLTGENQLGATGEAHDDAMSRTDVINPGAIEMMRREAIKLATDD